MKPKSILKRTNLRTTPYYSPKSTRNALSTRTDDENQMPPTESARKRVRLLSQETTSHKNDSSLSTPTQGKRLKIEHNAETFDRVKIALRVRPPDEALDSTLLVSERRCTVAMLGEKGHYVFDKVYGASHDLNSQQEEIYNDIGAEMLAALLNDRHCAFMAYGETGSGKTLTVTGERHARGVLPRFCEALFDELSDAIASGEATVHLSYCEIYQEQVYDLLSAWTDQLLWVQFVNGRAKVVDLRRQQVHNAQHMNEMIAESGAYRVTAPTVFNERSSRSHAITIIEVTRKSTIGDNASESTTIGVTSRAYFVDLAGSERVHQTSETSLARSAESIDINLSLLHLNRVIRERADSCRTRQHRHINYRDSPLTMLLCEALSGNACTYLIATVRDAKEHLGVTKSTLNMASLAREMIINVEQQNHGSALDAAARKIRRQEALIENLQEEVAEAHAAKGQLENLQRQVDSQKKLIDDLRRQLREAERIKRERDNLLEVCDELCIAWNDMRGQDMAGRNGAYSSVRMSRP